MAEEGEAPDGDDKTEAASPERIRKAREQGDVALSREVAHLAALGAGALALAMAAPVAGRDLAEAGAALFARSHELDLATATAGLLRAALPVTLGVGLLAGAAALAATLLQTGFLVHAQGLTPKLSKLNPLSGAKRIFGKPALEELARSLLKLGAGAFAAWWAVGSFTPMAETLAGSPADLMAALAALLGRLFSAGLAALAVVALADLAWVRLQHARKLRMSREELKREMKEQEGDPLFKARRRQVAMQRSRKRMLAAVPKATVVVTNPTHYAVALAYERGQDAAPRVVAKGVDAMAARIRKAAEEHGVPIVPNPPLARALYRLEDDAQIPAEHFQAVAEIIAFVWRLRGLAGGGQSR